MKLVAVNTIIAAFVILFSNLASAAVVEDARINVDNQTIEIDVTYSGGCEQHQFEVKVRNCTRADQMTCIAELVDTTSTDQCRQIVQETIEVPSFDVLGKMAIADLVIVGDNDSAVRLPLR